MRIHARLHEDERGFSLLETVIAITVIFGSLITLAMSASSGFRYVGIGREQQVANQVANQLMEQARGLAFSKIQRGMQASGLATDPNLVTSCAGDAAGTYRLRTCSGDKAVSTSLNCPTQSTDCAQPIVPSTGSVGDSAGYAVDYTWRSYVTNNCPQVQAGCTDIDPYKVTIVVTWPGAGTSPSGIQGVTTESLFHSPPGCVNSSTHPFAAPCQPFFYGQALVPSGRLEVEGSVTGVDFLGAAITTTAAESTMQIEQVSQVQGSWTQTGTELTTSAGTTFGGGTISRTTAADSDPSGTTPPYQVSLAGVGTASNQFASGGGSFVQVQNAAGDVGQAISTTAAGGLNVCPPTPPAPPLETDLQPCGGAMTLHAGIERVVGHLHGFAVDVGDATLMQVAAPTINTTTLTNRMIVPGTDGNIQETATRTFGVITIGGLPDLILPPVGWLGHLMQLTSYRDTVVSTAGTSAAAPSAAINLGLLSYWNGLGYTVVNLTTTPGYSLSGILLDHTTLSGGHTVRVRMASDDPITMGSVPTTTTSTTGCNLVTFPTCKTESLATIGSPISGSFTYEVWVDGTRVVDLLLLVELGTIQSKSIYGPPPVAG